MASSVDSPKSSPTARPPSRGFARILTAPLLALSLLSTIIFLGVTAMEMNDFITAFDKLTKQETNFPGLLATIGGNGASVFIIIFGPIAGVAAVGSHIVGLHNLRVWTSSSLGAAQASAWVAFGLLWLPFFVTCKEIHIGGHIIANTLVISAFVIIATLAHFAYSFILIVLDW